ncbi:MAG: SET domain-containing protein-lysine N-methyltransferase [Promethearchaeota archaeon]
MESLFTIKHLSQRKGRGLIATKNIPKDTIIDIAHLIFISDKEYQTIKNTSLDNYVFEWDPPDGGDRWVIAMSPCEFMNHSYDPNIKYVYNYNNSTIIFSAIKDVKKGEELTTNYNGNEEGKDPVWFEVDEE